MRRGLGAALRRALPALGVLAAAGAVVGAGFLGHHWLTTSPRFGLAEVDVRGGERLGKGEVLERLGVPEGHNLFRLRTARLEAELAREPWIARARVQRRLPDRLLVEIEEHRAAGVAELGGLYLVDEQGSPFKRAAVDAGEAIGLPVLTGIGREEYLADPAGVQARLRTGLAIARLYGEVAGRPALGELRLDLHRGVTLFTYEGAVALSLGRGDLDELRRRLAHFDAAWAELSGAERRTARFVYVDRDEPERVTVAFAGHRDSTWEK